MLHPRNLPETGLRAGRREELKRRRGSGIKRCVDAAAGARISARRACLPAQQSFAERRAGERRDEHSDDIP